MLIMSNDEKLQRDILSAFHIDLDRCIRGLAATVSGARSVIDFNESECLLGVKGGRVRIFGKELNISVFENNTLEISGRIGGVEFI